MKSSSKLKNSLRQMPKLMKESVTEHFRFATLDFIFIIVFVNVFPLIFGAENTIVGVIFTIMMGASMARDMTAAPVRNFVVQAVVLVVMATAACFVGFLNPWIALPINLFVIFAILYAFTFEYSSNLYFPYILSYLFLIFISPVEPSRLPMRIAGMLFGAASIILYQIVVGWRKPRQTAHDVLLSMTEASKRCVQALLCEEVFPEVEAENRAKLRESSKMVYNRRRRMLFVSDAAFALIDAERGLENLAVALKKFAASPLTAEEREFLKKVNAETDAFMKFVSGEEKKIPEPNCDKSVFDEKEADVYDILVYVRGKLLATKLPKAKLKYRPTSLSLSVRLKAALKISPVKLCYAVRVSLLLGFLTLGVQLLGLDHGRWLLFTVASVSLPYADDVGKKAWKRGLATVIGGLVGTIIFALVPSAQARTAIMMLSGYLSFYFKDYVGNFACSTIGALGGAVFTGAFGWAQVATLFGIRVFYIVIGIAIALVFNCLVLPFKKSRAVEQLCRKYVKTVALLSEICENGGDDAQLYYNLVIQSHMLEQKLTDTAKEKGFEGIEPLLDENRKKVRSAHRKKTVTVNALSVSAESNFS